MSLFGFGNNVDGAEFKAFSDAWAWFSDESGRLAMFGCETCSGFSDAVSAAFEIVGELTGVETGLELGAGFLVDIEVEIGVGFLVDIGVDVP